MSTKMYHISHNLLNHFPSKLPIDNPLTMKTRRSIKCQDKSLQKSLQGFRLNPYYEQRDFFLSKARHKAELLSQATPQLLKRSRGRPPKKSPGEPEDPKTFKSKDIGSLGMKMEEIDQIETASEKKSLGIEDSAFTAKIEEETSEQARIMEKKRKFMHLKCKKSNFHFFIRFSCFRFCSYLFFCIFFSFI